MVRFSESPFLPEDQLAVDGKVQDTREAHGNYVAQKHIPACEPFYEKQDAKSQKKDCSSGEVVCQIQLEEPLQGCVWTAQGPVLPYIEI